MARGSDNEGLARVPAKEDSDFKEGKVNAGINDRGDARKGFGPNGMGKHQGEIVLGTKTGYRGGRS